MRNKSIVITILAVALLVGVTVSGCNRDKRTAMNTNRQSRSRYAEPARGVRPAEVLSASAYRPRPEGTASFVIPASDAPAVVAQNVHVQPVAYTTAYAEPTPTYTSQYGYSYSYSTPAPQQSQVYTYEQYKAAHTPELTMARASLPSPPPQQPAVYQAPAHYGPPIPELEPVRYRVPSERTTNRPAAEIIMSAAPDHNEMQRALAPLGQAVDPAQGWVPSPVTAMRY